ncbi:beta-propeller domain-containing protein [Parerythrobacter aurantius]|uniref:beta-propeller domain-containing protein n=1 Tax=Parerythrobacter aurantius TaxID=3127706 RepID=UPI003243C058
MHFPLRFALAVAFVSVLAAPAAATPVTGVVILDPSEIGAMPVAVEAIEVSEPDDDRAERVILPYQDRRYRSFATDRLETFASEGEFRKLLRDVQRLQRRSERYGSSKGSGPGQEEIVVAFMQDEQDPLCTVPEDCPEDGGEANIVVTGTRVSSNALSVATAVNVTNTQVAAVDEGDIVKMIGDYLIVLQDGRLFAIHYPTMKLTDRVDVYRKDSDGDPIGADWYDEMLVQGDQVIVTAYSYSDSASEITVLRLDRETGKIAPRGVFLISSEDYYDVDNYATRIVGDRLVIYTPYEAERMASRRDRPAIRRWQPDEDFEEARARGRPLLDVQDIYKPIFGLAEPWIHTVSICPLAPVETKGLECASTAFMGTDAAEMYVSGEAVYLWTTAVGYDDRAWRDCDAGAGRPQFGGVAPGAVFRIPVLGGKPGVLGVRGAPFDQFGMDSDGDRFRSLASWSAANCDNWYAPNEVALFEASESRFGDRYVAARPSDFVALPSVPRGKVENRFAGDWLVYGSRDRWARYAPDDEDEIDKARRTVVQAVPLADPGAPRAVSIGHSLIRLERIGPTDVVANGYADESGLRVSYLGLEGATGVRSSAFLPGRYESESRSHAFNATVDAAGEGMLGIPTVTRKQQAGGWWWYSDTSDLSFLGFNDAGRLNDAGQLLATPENEVRTGEEYSCEVSCIDWYGNARPIFLKGKVYGLMATELVEAEVVGGTVTERRRVDLTGAVQP